LCFVQVDAELAAAAEGERDRRPHPWSHLLVFRTGGR
jgi:hypothetical protein